MTTSTLRDTVRDAAVEGAIAITLKATDDAGALLPRDLLPPVNQADDGLYIGRPVVNHAQLRAWATQHGIRLVPDPHVTVLYSTRAITMPIARASVYVWPDAFKSIGALGPKGARVLFLDVPELAARNAQARTGGAEETWPTYRPHVTLWYEDDAMPSGLDPKTIPLPDFPIILGPEAAGPLWDDVFWNLFPDRAEASLLSAATWKADTPYAGLRWLLEQRTPHTIAALRQGADPRAVRKMAPERLVSGWGLVSNAADGRALVDKQREWVPLPTIARAMKGFMAGERILGGLHLQDEHGAPLQFGTVTEALIVTPQVKKILDLPRRTPFGAAITAHVASDVGWRYVEAKTFRMFSIGGIAQKRRVQIAHATTQV